jgi:hypothetical protein
MVGFVQEEIPMRSARRVSLPARYDKSSYAEFEDQNHCRQPGLLTDLQLPTLVCGIAVL